jgi:hypothetical protein
MQRLHENDLVGHVLEQEAWEVVSFPAIAEEDQADVIESPFGSRTHHGGPAMSCIPHASRWPR